VNLLVDGRNQTEQAPQTHLPPHQEVVMTTAAETLSGFNAPKSTCQGVCGDGIVTRGEACDLGAANNTGDYGTCNPDCTLPPRCGDGIVQSPPEECDDGVNLSTYGQVDGCAPGCRKPPYCGDGKIDGAHEGCDEGPNNGHASCTIDCHGIIL
jgi:cysteine-rich repeat protein